MKDDRHQRMEIARTAARLASLAMEQGERRREITVAVTDLDHALQGWKENLCSLDSSGD